MEVDTRTPLVLNGPAEVEPERSDNSRTRKEMRMGASYERITVEDKGGVTIVRFKESDILDQINIQEIGEEMYSVVENTPNLKLVVDFQGVEYLSSTALGKLITLKKKVEAAEGKLRLAAIKPEIMEVFRITRLDTIFDIEPNVGEALKRF
jgi:anti-sigma B factor antagonist